MAETAAYCSDCYNKLGKSGEPHDPKVQAAEKAGNAPMTKNAACSKCGKSTVVIYYAS